MSALPVLFIKKDHSEFRGDYAHLACEARDAADATGFEVMGDPWLADLGGKDGWGKVWMVNIKIRPPRSRPGDDYLLRVREQMRGWYKLVPQAYVAPHAGNASRRPR